MIVTPKVMARLLEHAIALEGVEQGVACEGTALERRTAKVRGKAFLFLGVADAMLKLDASLPEALSLEREDPSRFRVGKGGWVKLAFTDAEPPPLDVAARWIAESHALAAATSPKKPVAAKKPGPAKRATKPASGKTSASGMKSAKRRRS